MTSNPSKQFSNANLMLDGSESHHASCHGDGANKQVEEIAKRESQVVRRLRLLMLIALVCSAVAVSLSIYFYLHNAETQAFELQFNSDAAKLLDSIGKTIDNTMGAADAFVVQMIAHARDSNSSWPFVTMPNFALHATKVLKLSKAIQLSVKHLVYEHQRDQWEFYANSSNGWIQDSLDIQEKIEDWRFPIIREFNVSYSLMGVDIKSPIKEPYPYYKNSYFPTWQASPIITGPANPIPYNRDMWAVTKNMESRLRCVESKKATFEDLFWGIIMNQSDPVEVYVAGLAADWGAIHIPAEEGWRSREPSISMNYPMIDAVDAVEVDIYNRSQEVVGAATFVYYFRFFLQGILPPNTKGIRLVVENDCGPQVFTYQVDGEEAVYLGQTDVHESKYDHLVHTATMGELVSYSTTKMKAGNNTQKKSAYTGVPLADEFCTKTFKVYPSSMIEAEYHTNQPALFASVSALIFIVTSFIFIFYDWYVAHRQRIVMGRAKASGAIVDSLFPETVRDQLYQEQRNADAPEQANGYSAFKNDAALTASVNEASGEKSRPIAQVYEATTIFFMDLAGFTQWSSTRQPAQVFELLEAVYWQFDKIAVRRKVFKVETIGDCYVAVTGIPHPQDDHAVIMVKFARDAMLKFSQIKNDLVPSLGPDTADLEMRVGLHSGSTIGGVLRGEKGRFQLFGDTVNTASRMESNGVKGRIHCSEATAAALIGKGKGSWLTPREDKVIAKGKGEMQTYFVHPTGASGRESVTSGVSTLKASTTEAGTAESEVVAGKLHLDDGGSNSDVPPKTETFLDV